ncbi:MAG TPA: MlaD family protein [Bacteroidales bacterium]|nr:MCE family protein [Bacteroidales bacterium]HNR42135.1 MlaD family protein [Bacteroidales bacterium]
MKKLTNEVKVGITVFLTIIVFIWLYNFLKGKEILSNKARYYVVYDKIAGLVESSPVEVNGYKVGIVQAIRFLNPVSGKLLVVLSVDKGFRLPVNSVAEITTASLIAGMKVQLVFGNGPGFYSSNDTIPGRLVESVITRLENEIIPLKNKAESVIQSLDTTLGSINDIMTPEFRNNVNAGIASLRNTADGIEKADLGASLENIKKLTEMLAENTTRLSRTFENLESVTDTLVAADLYSTVNNLRSSLGKLTVLVESLTDGKGTAGQLMTNDSLYINLNRSLASLDLLLQDLKSNPRRYVHFSMFGRKN